MTRNASSIAATITTMLAKDPIIFSSMEHEDYHKPGDSPDKIDYQKMEKITRTVYMTLWEVANRATRVKVDKPLPSQLTGS